MLVDSERSINKRQTMHECVVSNAQLGHFLNITSLTHRCSSGMAQSGNTSA